MDLACYTKHPTPGRDDLIEGLSLLLSCEEWTLGTEGDDVKSGSRKTSWKAVAMNYEEIMLPWARVKAEKVGRDVFWCSDYRTGRWSKCGR